ncbi:ras-like protein family member 12 [Asterias rubens]|uniref:ras-like protein family member 12 n=1 Tax=Asterias rubens TaxID=7604 RepID=UPI00145584EA|nr:ras-like protein family member 12 [Asterias rubens]
MSYRPVRNRSSGASGMIVPEYKIALLGSLGVGKSALTVKFITRRFINEYDPTLEDTYSKEDVIDNQTMLVRLMDTAHGDAENLERYIQWADGLMVVYSITSKHSFNYAKNLLLEISELQKSRETHEAPVILVGNKNEMERYRQVSKLDGSSLATQYACSYHEVSAAGEFKDVENVFQETVREIRREADRHVPLKPLFISEEKTIPPSPPSSRKDRDRAKSPQPKAPRVLQKRTVSSFKFFNKGFKIF